MRQIDIDKLSLKGLMELDRKVQKATAIAKDRARADLKVKIEKMATESGFAVSELFPLGWRSKGKGSRGKAIIKYVNPDNASETWTGRGRKPLWLVAKVSKGVSLDELLI